MWDGYLALGGLEIANSARAIGYSRSGNCPLWWFEEAPCEGFLDSEGIPGYDLDGAVNAPWYDPDVPELSAAFYGVYPLSIEGIPDSTAGATVVQKTGVGGSVGLVREGSKAVRVRAFLAASSEQALEYGHSWLDASLTPGACGAHGTACGSTDLAFFDGCPPLRNDYEDDDTYAVAVDARRRFLHTVKRVSGPLVQEEFLSNDRKHRGRIVEFTLVAEVPFVYGLPLELELPPVTPIVITDLVKNLVESPSAEIAGGDIVISINHSQNPSLEVNATDWGGSVTGLSGSAPGAYGTRGRVTSEVSAVGLASYRNRILGNGSTTAAGRASLVTYHDVLLDTLGAGSRPSFAIWAALVSVGGNTGAVLNGMSANAQWRNAGGNVGAPVDLGSTTDPVDFIGRAYAKRFNVIPAGADRVRLSVVADVNWSSNVSPTSNSDIRLYADAAAVTVP